MLGIGVLSSCMLGTIWLGNVTYFYYCWQAMVVVSNILYHMFVQVLFTARSTPFMHSYISKSSCNHWYNLRKCSLFLLMLAVADTVCHTFVQVLYWPHQPFPHFQINRQQQLQNLFFFFRSVRTITLFFHIFFSSLKTISFNMFSGK